MTTMIELSDAEWALVEDLFDPTGREGAPARYPRRAWLRVASLACLFARLRVEPA